MEQPNGEAPRSRIARDFDDLIHRIAVWQLEHEFTYRSWLETIREETIATEGAAESPLIERAMDGDR